MGIPWLTYLQALCKTIGQSPIKDRNVRFGDVADCLILYIIEKPSPRKALRFLVTFLMCIKGLKGIYIVYEFPYYRR